MAELGLSYSDNVGGFVIVAGKKVSFYVDQECILCSVCSDAAPNNFRMADSEDHDICYKQPENEDEFEHCIEAMDNCPVDAIGSNGLPGTGMNPSEVLLDRDLLVSELHRYGEYHGLNGELTKVNDLARHLIETEGDDDDTYLEAQRLSELLDTNADSPNGLFSLLN